MPGDKNRWDHLTGCLSQRGRAFQVLETACSTPEDIVTLEDIVTTHLLSDK